MELKPYQQQVIDDLSAFLDYIQESKDVREAFRRFWEEHPRTPLQPFPGTAVEPYKNNIKGTPHICMKVPTAGGKTFIACNALRTIFNAFDPKKPRAVAWLVPSITILEQTLKNLKNPSHPYRLKINAHFGSKAEVFDKAALLQGSGFNASTIKDQLNIMVFSFDSLRARNKEDRKVFQENGNLQSFSSLPGMDPEITLGAVIRYLNPVVVVDESHNAESELSVDMLRELNPCFILDLTATPRNNSNIISFTDALDLKKENMVKLPVIVYNHYDKTEVIHSSVQLRRQLEESALEEQKQGGKYIRPIVLFQVQPKNGKDFRDMEDERSNVQKLKDQLLELRIPEEQISIKTANINEIKGVDLMSDACPVRYIITINALKEGWDCPFAYILASLADRSSAVDVEQILGRILRQPYVMKHRFPLLNLSYVLTASSRFLETLDNIVKGLNKSGFSDKDYKLPDGQVIEKPKPVTDWLQLTVEPAEKPSPYDSNDEIDTRKLLSGAGAEAMDAHVQQIMETAIQQNEVFEKTFAGVGGGDAMILPTEIRKFVKTYVMKEIFREQAQQLKLPRFFVRVQKGSLFFESEEYLPLSKENLLEGFALSRADINISFDNVESQLYKIDLDETRKEHTPTFIKLDGQVRENVMEYILDPEHKTARVANVTHRIMNSLGSMLPVPDKEIRKYVARILEDFTDEQFNDLLRNENSYTARIRQKIRMLTDNYAETRFRNFLDTDKVIARADYRLPLQIMPSMTSKDIVKSLYDREGAMNGFEERMINEIGNMSNIAFWTRNTERQGFCINGFINHYPDFIIYTKSGKTILLETKGDHLDAEQKIRLGNLWAGKAGNDFRYYMVYENRSVDGACKADEFLNLMRSY